MLMRIFNRLRHREEGQALVEYALILSLIAICCVGARTLRCQNVNNILNTIANGL